VQTGERLVEIYVKREQWEQAELIGEMLVRKADPKNRGILIDLNLRLGNISLECEHEDKALAAFRAAYDLDPTNQRTLKDLAGLLYARHEYEEAGKLFQALLVHRRDTLEAGAIVDVFYKLGEIKKTMGEESKALNMYEKALDIEPTNQRVLERAIALYQAKEDFEAVFRCKRNILKGIEDEEARITLAEEIGDLLQEKLRRYNEANTFYNMVIEARPDHRRVLNKIMETHILQKKWDEAIVAMGKIEDYETDPEHRSRLHYTAAVIFRDQLGRPKEAAHHFDQALVKDPSNRRAFDSLKKLYREQQNFKGLVKAYRLMLKRLPEETSTEEQVQLWHELGEICQEKLHDAKGAIVAFEVAAKLDPSNEARQERLAQLYITAGPDAYEKAILAHQRRLKSNPLRQEAYKELRRLYAEVGEYDKAWCVAAVLGWLKKASDEEMALYRKHRNEAPRRLARKLSDDLWQDYLYHEQQHSILNEVFATAAPLMAPMAVRPAKAHNLGEELNVDEDSRPYAKVADYVGQVMDRSVSRYYLCKEIERGHQLWPVLIGSPEEINTGMKVQPRVVQSESQTELHYWFTKALALLRPEHFLTYATPSSIVLRAIALSVLKAVKPSLRIGGDVEEVSRLSDIFRTDLPANKLDLLAGRASELRDLSTGEEIGRWIEGVELSTTRAALVVCDDLESAAKLLSTEPVPEMTDHSAKVKQRLQELMVFAVSEDYFKLRELLGLQVR
jgi:tetratricopeptide (TPR) repeat protein